MLTTIERSDSVSALDWVDSPLNEGDNGSVKTEDVEKSQLLAVGGFDGVVSIYSIAQGTFTKKLVTLLYDLRVKTEVTSMAFLRDSATNYVPYPLALFVGENNGTVSNFLIDGEAYHLKSPNKMNKIVSHDSAVLATAFGFLGDSIILATGTKQGLLRVNSIIFHEGEWKLSHLLFEYLRTGSIRALRFNHDSTSLIVGGYDKTVLIVDTYMWKTVGELYVDGTVSFTNKMTSTFFQSIHQLFLIFSCCRCAQSNMIHTTGKVNLEFFSQINGFEIHTHFLNYRYILLGTKSKILTIIDTSTLQPIKMIHTSGWVTVSKSNSYFFRYLKYSFLSIPFMPFDSVCLGEEHL